jgi:hypothetical protein
MIAAGMAEGPAHRRRGRSISTTGGHMDPRNGMNPGIPWRGRAGQCLRRPGKLPPRVRLQIGRGVDVIKIADHRRRQQRHRPRAHGV